MEFLMLLHQPTPDAVPDIEVECSELTACAGAEAIVVSPSPQNRIEFLEKLRQRPERVGALVICFTVCRRSARLLVGISILGI
jgi:hypothetical protein